jgi:hypothetical protein
VRRAWEGHRAAAKDRRWLAASSLTAHGDRACSYSGYGSYPGGYP